MHSMACDSQMEATRARYVFPEHRLHPCLGWQHQHQHHRALAPRLFPEIETVPQPMHDPNLAMAIRSNRQK